MNDNMKHRNETASLMERVLYEVKRVVVGQDHFLERVLVATPKGTTRTHCHNSTGSHT